MTKQAPILQTNWFVPCIIIIFLYNIEVVFAGGYVMHTTSLRKVGGSVMMTVPPAVLDLLDLEVGSIVGMDVDGERLVIHSQKRPRYTLDELLAQCNADAPITAEERDWLDLKPVGDEL
jgi:antitoxin ChpS